VNGCTQEVRTSVVSRQLEINEVEKSLQQSIKAIEVLLLVLTVEYLIKHALFLYKLSAVSDAFMH